MHNVLRSLSSTFSCLDNVLVASKSEEEHTWHLFALFTQLNDNSLIVRPEKCIFGQQELEFLGHSVGADNIHPLLSGVTAIQDFPQPMTVCQLRRFLC